MFSGGSRSAVGAAQPRIQCVPRGIFPRIKRLGREAHQSPLVSKFNNVWRRASSPLPNVPSRCAFNCNTDVAGDRRFTVCLLPLCVCVCNLVCLSFPAIDEAWLLLSKYEQGKLEANFPSTLRKCLLM